MDRQLGCATVFVLRARASHCCGHGPLLHGVGGLVRASRRPVRARDGPSVDQRLRRRASGPGGAPHQGYVFSCGSASHRHRPGDQFSLGAAHGERHNVVGAYRLSRHGSRQPAKGACVGFCPVDTTPTSEIRVAAGCGVASAALSNRSGLITNRVSTPRRSRLGGLRVRCRRVTCY